MDKIYDEMLKEAKKRGVISQQITVGVSDEQMDILKIKADVLSMSVEEFVHGFLLRSSIFNAPVVEKKKPKTVVKNDSEGGEK
ncbi:MAG TPA: hypothetical protein PLM93_12140 [Sulfuricurvum sp.]|jgi:hypothetical protein|nr:MAG: hypothetical protein B7X89_11570 [Sulfuricurvum sp. 17-40-25]HQS67927.1 hypothetical protein [Sulfuricurvum sp.]HQT37622.1 hypothetical protein [Sulfuricurvum sp.]